MATRSTKINQKADLIWAIADKLTGVYKPHEYGDVILPLTVIRRFDCILSDTKDAVLKKYDEVKNLFEQQTTIVRDRYKNRWVKCEICGEIKRDYDFLSYGGENHVNLGQCRECSVRMRNQK